MPDLVVLADWPETSPFLHSGWSAVSSLLRAGLSTGSAFPGTLSPPYPHPHPHPHPHLHRPFLYLMLRFQLLHLWPFAQALQCHLRGTQVSKVQSRGAGTPGCAALRCSRAVVPQPAAEPGHRQKGGTSKLAQEPAGRVQGRLLQASAGHSLGSSTAASALPDMQTNPATATDARLLLSMINSSKPPNRHHLLALLS